MNELIQMNCHNITVVENFENAKVFDLRNVTEKMIVKFEWLHFFCFASATLEKSFAEKK